MNNGFIMPPAGLEPATLWLEATRAIRLRHEGYNLKIYYIFYLFPHLPTVGVEPTTTRLKVLRSTD